MDHVGPRLPTSDCAIYEEQDLHYPAPSYRSLRSTDQPTPLSTLGITV